MIAGIAQLGERQIEDLKVTCLIHVHRTWQLHILCYSGWLSWESIR